MSTILIVDDQVTNRRVLSQLAGTVEDSVWIETFENPVEALKWVGTAVPDLVVTDFNMPQMNGAEFIRRFRASEGCADIPVMIVTAYEDSEFRYLGLEAGATDFLISPVDHREFTTRVRNLLALRASVRQKERLAALGSAVAKIHHDLRNILTSARLLSDYMTLSGDETVQKVAPTLIRAVDRAVHLTTQTLDFLRGDRGAPKPESFSLAELVGEIFETMRGAASDVSLTPYIDSDVLVHADRLHIERVLTNLVRNALQAGARKVEISAHDIAENIIVDVSDDGPGLPEERARDIFRPMGVSTTAGGTGLGLAIARELITAHGGTIELISTSAQDGTRFRITLPQPVHAQSLAAARA